MVTKKTKIKTRVPIDTFEFSRYSSFEEPYTNSQRLCKLYNFYQTVVLLLHFSYLLYKWCKMIYELKQRCYISSNLTIMTEERLPCSHMFQLLIKIIFHVRFYCMILFIFLIFQIFPLALQNCLVKLFFFQNRGKIVCFGQSFNPLTPDNL